MISDRLVAHAPVDGTKYILSALSRLPGFKKNTGKSEGKGIWRYERDWTGRRGDGMDFLKAILHMYKISKQPLKGKNK